MKKLFTFLLLLAAFASKTYASDTTRVLFIGNSFTAVENVPGLVQQLATQAGKYMEVLVHAPGGISVGDVSQGQMAHMNNPMVFDMIRNSKIDYLVLQDNQGRFVDENRFPDPSQSKVVEGHQKILDSMRRYHPCARMVFFAGWALKNCWPDVGDGEKCIRNIYGNYLTLNGMLNEIVSPIGIAWLRSITALPAVDLWSPDEAHQSREGGFLTASVIFTSIYRINTEHVNFTAGIDPATAAALRRIAYETVIDSIAPTNLASHIPALDYDGTQFTASGGYSNYDWYRNDTLITSTTVNTHAPVTSGSDCYQVIVTDNNGCTQRSVVNCQEVTTGIKEIEKTLLVISPNPAGNYINVSAGNTSAIKQYTISDAMGRVVSKGIFTSSTPIDIQQLPAGIYVCKIAMNGQLLHAKFIKQN